ncbi:sugar transporter [Corynespora cassiicola Philippines]|uniref:Sugar transporter n=1 Tax=Corynespora cassiicola Philippines TaxID=1448308 RepID=A0A2T2NKF5_CORCC|nr:sugar transporter [Corynespora cassiicola Philippines]
MFGRSQTKSRSHAAVGEDLARVLPDDNTPWYRKGHLVLLNYYVLCMILLAAANGYDGSMMNGLQSLPQWDEFMNRPRSTWLGFINSLQPLSSILAYPVSAYFANRWGRKKGLLIGYFFLFLGALLQTFTPNAKGWIAGRFFLGQPSAWWGNLAPLLITEVSFPTQRGLNTSLYNCGWYIGSLLAAWATFGTRSYTSSWAWRIPSLLQIAIPLVSLPGVLLIPESPRYLIAKGQAQKARETLTRFHAGGDANSLLVDFEMEEIQRAIEADRAAQSSTSWLDLFKGRGNKHRAWISITLGVFAQWNGVNVVSYYLSLVLSTAGISSVRDQTLINGCMQIWNLFWASGAALSVDRLGRRTLFLTSCIGMFVSFAIVTGLSGGFDNTGNKSTGLAVIPFLFLYYGFYDIAFTPLVVSYPAEIWPYHLRARGLALTFFSTYLGIFFNTFVSPIALSSIGWRYYIIFVIIVLFGIVMVWFTYPETKGHTLEEMNVVFDGEAAALGAGQALKIGDGDKDVTTTHIENSV